MKNTIANLQNINMPCAALLQQTPEWQQYALGAICFSAEPVTISPALSDDMPLIAVKMQPLASAPAVCEVWYSSAPLIQGKYEAVRYRCNEDVVFGVITLAEADFIGTADHSPLQQATEAAYRQISTLLEDLRYPYVFRFWNYMADINGYSHGLERYRQFNLGRQDALLAHGREVVGNVPAACALGAESGALSIAFLAGRVAPVAIENPRQLSAYTYPETYGPRSPTFSRASLVCLGMHEYLFISGTASIVGHASLHSGDVIAQTRETMTNIEAVLAEANRRVQFGNFNLTDLYYRVYVKHPADVALIRAELASRIGATVNAIYLHADVCRQELLVEIEATASNI